MIRPLRARHRTMVILLSGIVPVLFIAALVFRPSPPPANTEIPNPLIAPDGFTDVIGLLTPVQGFEDILYRLNGKPGTSIKAISLQAAQSVRLPELLIYWSINQDVSNGQLLGTWAVTAPGIFVFPESESGTGWIILYDLAKKQNVAAIQL